MSDAISYKDTLNLPKTAFDMKANLTQREPAMVKKWAEEGLYQKIRAARKSADPSRKWVLHDGPPYANGDIHMGHLINKVLKDMVVKFRTIQGLDSPFVPGWDCHGLPIESAIQKELGPKFRELSKDEIRKRCRDYALKYVKLQGESFERLGIFGEFSNPYLTLDKRYEGGILDVLAELVQRDLVYRQKKPVHWCTNDRTALAEAELEYQSKKDTSIYVSFLIYEPEDCVPDPLIGEGGDWVASQPELMIWTTTPWTLPANRAVAVHPEHEYALVGYFESGERTIIHVANEIVERVMREKSIAKYTVSPSPINPSESIIEYVSKKGNRKCALLAKELVERVMQAQGITDFVVGPAVLGKDLTTIEYLHPLDQSRTQHIVLADYVTLEDGTGLVHTAPGHGKEDYQTGIKYGLEIYNPVLPDGRYDDTVPEFLRGKSIWDANKLVIDKLRETGALFHAEDFAHEYPHCWRCKKPVIFRATEQWFIRASGESGSNPNPPSEPRPSEPRPSGSGLDAPPARKPLPHGRGSDNSPLWSNAKAFVDRVQWIPEWGKNRIDGMLDTRPDWCISRQRSWGVPIPAFFDAQGKCVFNEAIVRAVAKHFREHGADSWYTHAPAQLLGLDTTSPHAQAQGLQSLGFRADLHVDTLEKGMDILDVWFESGASHHAVLECTHPELGYPAAMYLEGSDQHRGWFQSSLLEAAGYKSEPPFKQVLTHGFIVDEKGRKMSKSEGNDIKVNDALKQYGADILRLWVCSVDYQNDIPCGPALFAKIADAYRKIRNTIRYLLGNLYDFNPYQNATVPAPRSIDAWMQHRVATWVEAVNAAYDRYEFHQVFKLIYEFCNVEISSLYAKAIKDRLYCDAPDSPRRRASQSICFGTLLHLVQLCAPVLAFTAEETWQAIRALPGCNSPDFAPSIHLAAFTAPARDSAPTVAHWDALMPLIEKGNKQLDELKRLAGLGNPLDAEAVIIVPTVQDEISQHIAAYGPEIEDALGVGFHRIEHGEIWDIKIEDTRQKYASCARSWKRRPDVGSDKDYPDLSARDATVVRALRGG